MNATPDAVERYLLHLKKALRGAAPAEQEEILSDIRSLISEHLETADRSATAVEAVLERLGPPEALAEAYRTEGLLAQAAHSTAPSVLVRAALRSAAHGVLGFLTALVVFIGYTLSLGFTVVAIMKPFAPETTGLWVGNGNFFFGSLVGPHAQGTREVLGYWTIPVAGLLALLSFILTTRLARWFFRLRLERTRAPQN